MMKSAQIRAMRTRWEAEARVAAEANDPDKYLYWMSAIAALDLVLGDMVTSPLKRIPFPGRERERA